MSQLTSRGRTTERTPARSSWDTAALVLAFGTLVLLGWRQQLYHAVTIGYVLAGFLLPLWLPAVRRHKGFSWLFGVAGAALVGGFVLYFMYNVNHQVDSSKLIINPVLLVGLMLSIGVVLWARTLMTDASIGIAYGMGMFLGVGRTADVAINPWKFGYSLPVIVLVLSVAAWMGGRSGRKQRWPEIGVLLGLAGYSALHDSRSLFAMLALTVVLVIWQKLPQIRSRRKALATTILAGLAALIVIYELGSNLLVGGFLGAAAQQRSIAQIDSSGFLLLGGRPELAASAALFQWQPGGFGVGIVPSLNDIAVAKTGMLAINYEPNNGYVEKYMFGSQFELHSVAGDLWVYFGLLGLLLALTMGWLVLRWCLLAVIGRDGSALTLFVSVITAWNLLFSPLYTSTTIMALALGLVAISRPVKTKQGG